MPSDDFLNTHRQVQHHRGSELGGVTAWERRAQSDNTIEAWYQALTVGLIDKVFNGLAIISTALLAAPSSYMPLGIGRFIRDDFLVATGTCSIEAWSSEA